MSEWIKVSDRLPDDNTRVITSDDRKFIEIASCYEGVFFNDEGFPFIAAHWMPLPEPPKE